MLRIVIVLAFVCTLATLGFAQDRHSWRYDRTPVITRHQLHQRARIREGVRHGELTRAEAARLRHEQRVIQREKRMALAYGRVTRFERERIRHDQWRASWDIYRLKHNDRTREY